MKKNRWNIVLYVLAGFLITFGIACLVVNFTVCPWAWILTAICFPIGIICLTTPGCKKYYISRKNLISK